MYKSKSIAKYLDDLAARRPAPGGGSAAALSGAIGCALLSMAANFTLGKEKYKKQEKEIKRILAQSERARRRFLELMDLDIVAYSAFSRAGDKKEKQKAKRQSQRVVREIARLAYKAIDLSLPLAERGNVYLIGDVLAGAELLGAAFNSAVINIE